LVGKVGLQKYNFFQKLGELPRSSKWFSKNKKVFKIILLYALLSKFLLLTSFPNKNKNFLVM